MVKILTNSGKLVVREGVAQRIPEEGTAADCSCCDPCACECYNPDNVSPACPQPTAFQAPTVSLTVEGLPGFYNDEHRWYSERSIGAWWCDGVARGCFRVAFEQERRLQIRNLNNLNGTWAPVRHLRNNPPVCESAVDPQSIEDDNIFNCTTNSSAHLYTPRVPISGTIYQKVRREVLINDAASCPPEPDIFQEETIELQGCAWIGQMHCNDPYSTVPRVYVQLWPTTYDGDWLIEPFVFWTGFYGYLGSPCKEVTDPGLECAPFGPIDFSRWNFVNETCNTETHFHAANPSFGNDGGLVFEVPTVWEPRWYLHSVDPLYTCVVNPDTESVDSIECAAVDFSGVYDPGGGVTASPNCTGSPAWDQQSGNYERTIDAINAYFTFNKSP